MSTSRKAKKTTKTILVQVQALITVPVDAVIENDFAGFGKGIRINGVEYNPVLGLQSERTGANLWKDKDLEKQGASIDTYVDGENWVREED